MNWGCSRSPPLRLHRVECTGWYAGDEDVFKLISADHRVVVQESGSGDVSAEHVISNVVKCLFAGLVLVHVERVVHFGHEDALTTDLNRVYRRRQVLDLSLAQQTLSTHLIVTQAAAHSRQNPLPR